jgi:hypothetical protein
MQKFFNTIECTTAVHVERLMGCSRPAQCDLRERPNEEKLAR